MVPKNLIEAKSLERSKGRHTMPSVKIRVMRGEGLKHVTGRRQQTPYVHWRLETPPDGTGKTRCQRINCQVYRTADAGGLAECGRSQDESGGAVEDGC